MTENVAPIPDMIPVKVIWRGKHASLVEWVIRREDGLPDLRRAEIPSQLVLDGAVERGELEAGVPYGLPWEEIVHLKVTPEMIAIEFRRLGLWTYGDLISRPTKIAEAVQRVGLFSKGTVIQSAKRYLEKLEEKQ